MMATGSLSRLAKLSIMAIMALIITACQHRSPSEIARADDPWRVMERVGDVRATKNGEGLAKSLRPGEAVTDHHHVTTGAGTLLILARNGFQLTAGENTSFRLPGTEANPKLSLDYGWLRVRLAKSVDQEARIQTTEFDISASHATLTLRSDAAGTSLTVDAGSAVLATTDGRHRTTLIAGAAAKMAPRSGDYLMIKRASGQDFTAISPLPAATQTKGDDQTQPAPKVTEPQPVKTLLRAERLATAKAAPGSDLAIVPASRPKKAAGRPPESRKTITSTASLLQSKVSDTNPDHRGQAETGVRVIPSAKPEDDAKTPIADPESLDTSSFDPLQLQFDQLTKGLLDGL